VRVRLHDRSSPVASRRQARTGGPQKQSGRRQEGRSSAVRMKNHRQKLVTPQVGCCRGVHWSTGVTHPSGPQEGSLSTEGSDLRPSTLNPLKSLTPRCSSEAVPLGSAWAPPQCHRSQTFGHHIETIDRAVTPRFAPLECCSPLFSMGSPSRTSAHLVKPFDRDGPDRGRVGSALGENAGRRTGVSSFCLAGTTIGQSCDPAFHL